MRLRFLETTRMSESLWPRDDTRTVAEEIGVSAPDDGNISSLDAVNWMLAFNGDVEAYGDYVVGVWASPSELVDVPDGILKYVWLDDEYEEHALPPIGEWPEQDRPRLFGVCRLGHFEAHKGMLRLELLARSPEGFAVPKRLV